MIGAALARDSLLSVAFPSSYNKTYRDGGKWYLYVDAFLSFLWLIIIVLTVFLVGTSTTVVQA